MKIAKKEEIKELCKKYAEKYGLDWKLVYAIAQIENRNNQPLARFEPLFYEKYLSKFDISEDEKYLRACSYGLMQVMGQTAIEHGWNEPFSELFDTEKNLDLACKIIKKLFEKYREEELVISAYNGGLRKKEDGYHISNRGYVEKVLRQKMMLNEA